MLSKDAFVFGDSIARGVILDDQGSYRPLKDCFASLAAKELGVALVNKARFGCTIAKGREIIERTQGVLVKNLAGGRQRQLAGRAFEQASTELPFEIGNLCADLGPRTIHPARRLGHAAGFDDLDEAFPGIEPVHLSIIR